MLCIRYTCNCITHSLKLCCNLFQYNNFKHFCKKKDPILEISNSNLWKYESTTCSLYLQNVQSWVNKFYFMGNFILNNEGSDVGNAAITMVTDLNLWICMIFMLLPKTILIKQSFAPLTLIGQITKKLWL